MNHLKQAFNAIYSIVVLLSVTVTICTSTKCGKYICHENTECRGGGTENYKCECERGTIRITQGYEVYCDLKDTIEEQCLEKCSDKCCNPNEKPLISTTTEHNDNANASVSTTTKQTNYNLYNNCQDGERCLEVSTLTTVITKKSTSIAGELSSLKSLISTTIGHIDNTDASESFIRAEQTNGSTYAEDYATVAMEISCPEDHTACGETCCQLPKICNDLKKCVIFEPEPVPENQPILLTCPLHQQLCRNKCCPPQEICNHLEQCVDAAISTTSAECAQGENCTREINALGHENDVTYTSIGSAILLTSLAFGLFKLHSFKRS